MSRNLFSRLADWLFPPRCAFCGRACGTARYCGCKLPVMREHDVGKALHQLPPSDGYASPLFYAGGVRKAILDLKSRHCGENAEVLARMLDEACGKAKLGHIDIVTCIPSGKSNYRKRGYNPAELIARKLAERLGLGFEPLLICTKSATKQKTKTAQQRAAQIYGSFKTLCADLTGQSVLLVDDVMTTGSTLNEAVKTLKRAGAKTVYCAAAATTARKNKEE